jgi:hypothetical protein
MAAPTGTYYWFHKGVAAILNGSIPLVSATSDTLYAKVVTSSCDLHSMQATADFLNDLGDTEVTGDGYTEGGMKIVASVTVSGNEVRFIVTDPVWAAATITGRGIVFYKKVGTGTHEDTTSPLIGFVEFDQNISSTNGPWTGDIDPAAAHGGAAGYFTVAVPA